MFSGLLFIHRPSKAIALTLILSGAAILVGTLYAWLLTPLEPEHH